MINVIDDSFYIDSCEELKDITVKDILNQINFY
jgi:hypothetical protein